MAKAYPFLDLAALDTVRERLTAGDALAILSADLKEIIWSNGSGAALLGYPTIEQSIGNSPLLPNIAIRQLSALSDLETIGKDRPIALRIPAITDTGLVVILASDLILPEGEKAILIATPFVLNTEDNPKAIELQIISGISGQDQFAALLDANANIIAATTGFDALAIPLSVMKGLIDPISGTENRILKRRIALGHSSLPAGIARLRDDPALFMLIAVREEVIPLTESQEMDQSASSVSQAAEIPQEVQPLNQAEPTTVRFSWRTDAQEKISFISEELKDAVGEPAADIIGRSFQIVSDAFELDPDGDIKRLMQRRDTWSGKVVFWPISATSKKVPIELAALPAYGRDKTFEGFKGFGIARLRDAIEDPNAIGLMLDPLSGADKLSKPKKPENTLPKNSIPEISAPSTELPAATTITPPSGLTETERNAFREIGERLRRASSGAAADKRSQSIDTKIQQLFVEPEAVSVDTPDNPEPAQQPQPNRDKQLPPIKNDHKANRSLLSLVPEGNDSDNHYDGKPSRYNSVDAASLLAHLPIAVLVHSGDTLYYANKEMLQLSGYSDLDALHAAGGIGALLDAPLQRTPHNDAPLALRTAQGQKIPVQAKLQSIDWQDGKALMLALRPFTQQVVRREEISIHDQLGLSLNELQAVVDTATDGIVVLNHKGFIDSLNRSAEALFGFDSENVIGKPFSALFAIESQRSIQDYVTVMAENGVASMLNDGRSVIGREAHGRFIPLFVTLTTLPNERGFCAILRDLTTSKRVESELQDARMQAENASSQKSDFLARVSHEIRTPLNAIIGFSELMVDEKFGSIGNERYRDYLRDINQSGNHVLDLVNDLLDLSKIEAGHQDMHFEAVALNDILEQAVAMMQPQANSERVIIRSSFASSLPDVVADLRTIRQIALNILSNAVRYTPAGGQVIVSTLYNPDGSVVLRVRDSGIGMTSDEIDEALKPFRQINTMQRKRGDGTGLGLSLTKAMVKANRASLAISSTSGEGTLVEVTFPAKRVLADH